MPDRPTMEKPSALDDLDGVIAPEDDFGDPAEETIPEDAYMQRSDQGMIQTPAGPLMQPSQEKRRQETLRATSMAREVVWVREQLDIIGNYLATRVKSGRWDDVTGLTETAKLYHKVFGFIIEREFSTSTLDYRTKRIKKAIELYSAPADWLQRWQFRSPII